MTRASASTCLRVRLDAALCGTSAGTAKFASSRVQRTTTELAFAQRAQRSLEVQAVHDVHACYPDEPHRLERDRQRQYDAEQLRRVAQASVCGGLQDARKLHAQKHEYDAVQDEPERVPHALGLHALPGRLQRVAVRQQRHRHACHDHGDHGADVQLLAGQVDDERQQKLEGDVQVGAVDAAAADEFHQRPCEQAGHRSAEEAAEQVERELLAGMCQRERPGGREGDGCPEHDGAGDVVEEGLAGKQRLVALPEANVLGQLGYRDRVGGSHGGSERNRRSKRNGGQQRMQGEPDDRRRGDDEADGERGDSPAAAPKRSRVGVARLVEVQRCDEEDQQQLGVQVGLGGRDDEHADQGAHGDLHERQRQGRQEAADDARGHDGRHQEKNQLQCLHASPCGSGEGMNPVILLGSGRRREGVARKNPREAGSAWEGRRDVLGPLLASKFRDGCITEFLAAGVGSSNRPRRPYAVKAIFFSKWRLTNMIGSVRHRYSAPRSRKHPKKL